MVEQDQVTSINEFEIGVVSKITGISQHLLRIWERRYNVVNPRRNSSN
ncbi:MAG: MerR family transcriptional regulator, partial [Thermodesulfobacteriota bacterium]